MAYSSTHFTYACSNSLDSLMRRALHDDDTDDLPVKDSSPASDSYNSRNTNIGENSSQKPILYSDNAKATRSQMEVDTKFPLTSARVEAMLKGLDALNDDDLDLYDDSNPSLSRRTRMLVQRFKRKVTKTIKKTTSMTNLKL